ncbi:MAG: hypothetical protein JSW29_06760 [Candidatus Bathyarchaeota archaeon]|nr:MAG: hypothetical protein JSW29_06760 [Candidatus Bathyarchaeota archaeon]
MEDWKIKTAVLWLFPLVGFLASAVLLFMEPGVLAELVEEGTIEGMQAGTELLLVGAAIDILGPLVMAFLSLTLKGSINRWLNVIVGGIYAVLEFITLLEELANPKGYVVLMLIAAVVAPALIVWYAWKSKQEV